MIDIGLMVEQLEKCGYFLYYDDVTKLWYFFNNDSDSDAPLFDFKNVDKDKVITQVYFTVFDH